jgi:cytochrome c oxidase cbb3-type subunit III
MTHGVVTSARNFAYRVSGRRARLTAVILTAFVVVATYWAIQQIRIGHLKAELLSAPTWTVTENPALVRFAAEQARPLFAAHCASCHGADMKGDRTVGTPNLVDTDWLYGTGTVFDIERTILFGIRSGEAKARNVTDMRAFGQRGLLSDSEIRNVVQYVLQLSHQRYQPEAATEGSKIFAGKGECYDCHGSDARGDYDYGAPDLTVNIWSYGGDPQSLYNSVYFGRHGICPAWLGPLDLEQIRALAVYIYAASHQGT